MLPKASHEVCHPQPQFSNQNRSTYLKKVVENVFDEYYNLKRMIQPFLFYALKEHRVFQWQTYIWKAKMTQGLLITFRNLHRVQKDRENTFQSKGDTQVKIPVLLSLSSS